MRPKTEKTFNELCALIPGGANSPIRACRSMKQLPMVVDYGVGDTLVDIDGHSYIDYCLSWGALIHGHAHPQILGAVSQRMAKGTSFGISTQIELDLASKIVSLIESIEKIRFVCSGTEATMSAARLARGFTGKEIIVKFSGNYHGHADFFLIQAGSGLIEISPTSSSKGIPLEIVKHTLNLPYNDIEACKKIFSHPDFRDRIAAVILEPVAGNMGVVPATQPFVEYLRKATKEIGSLLIFDEVITGFRVGKKGAQGFYGICPDLTCFGKIVGGGFPSAAFGGRREIMDYLAPDGPVYQAGTLAGNPVAMEAGLQGLMLLDSDQFYEKLAAKTERLVGPLKERIKEKGWNACVQQAGSMFTIFFGRRNVNNFDEALMADGELFAQFFRFLFSKGVYISPLQQEACFVSSAHTDENIDKTADLMIQFMDSHCYS